MALFEKELRVQYSYCDWRNQMPLSYLLKEAQEISMQHCDQLGIGSAALRKRNMVFLLSKIQVTVARMPVGGETVRVRTVPYLPVRLQYPRFTFFYDAQGALLAQVDSRWVLVETDTRKIFRRPPAGLSLPFPESPPLEEIKLPRTQELLERETIRVRYAQTDVNGHLNNASYADLVCNCLEEHFYEQKQVGRFSIAYHHEALRGEEITLLQGEEGGLCSVKGMLPSGPCFESAVTFSPRASAEENEG